MMYHTAQKVGIPITKTLTGFESSMVIEDGFIYFYDCDGISPSKLSDNYCWFKARKVKYHIIPD